MATYNNLNCPDRKCFASTVIRDTAGISELVKQRNITLQSSSDSTKTWNKAIGELANGNYRQATQSFNTAASLYPQNYLAAQFAAYSKSQYSTATDTSTMNTIVSLLQVLLAVCAGLLYYWQLLRLHLGCLLSRALKRNTGNSHRASILTLLSGSIKPRSNRRSRRKPLRPFRTYRSLLAGSNRSNRLMRIRLLWFSLQRSSLNLRLSHLPSTRLLNSVMCSISSESTIQ